MSKQGITYAAAVQDFAEAVGRLVPCIIARDGMRQDFVLAEGRPCDCCESTRPQTLMALVDMAGEPHFVGRDCYKALERMAVVQTLAVEEKQEFPWTKQVTAGWGKPVVHIEREEEVRL